MDNELRTISPVWKSTQGYILLHNRDITGPSPAASPVGDSLDGRDSLNRSSISRDSHCGLGHQGLISLSQ